MKKLLLIMLIAIGATSCDLLVKDQVVTIENKYTLTVPSFLAKTKDLNDAAALQYQNPAREFYVIVIDEKQSEMSKAITDNGLQDVYSDDLKGYSELLLTSFKETMTNPKMSEIVDTVINGMPARVMTINAFSKAVNLDIYYELAFMKGKTNYYQLMTWTLATKEEDNKERMNKIAYSLKEI